MNDMYNRIRKLREEKNMSQEELALLVGYTSRSTIAKIEAGKNDIPQTKIKAFADALGVTPSFLMGWEESTESKNIDNVVSALNHAPEHEEFDDPISALEFILAQPTLQIFGGYDLETITNEELIAIANDILYALRVSVLKRIKK